MSSKAAELQAQIAAYTAQLDEELAKERAAEERRQREAAKILIESTPTKKRPSDVAAPDRPAQPVFGSARTLLQHEGKAKPPKQELPTLPNAIAGPSRMGGGLAALRKPSPSGNGRLDPSLPARSGSNDALNRAEQTRASGSRTSKGSTPLEVVKDGGRSTRTAEDGEGTASSARTVQRDQDTLAVVEDLQPGPKDFGRDPEGGFGWEQVEPYSHLRLSKRVMSHTTVQDHLYGRYHLSPSMLYSVIRMSRDGSSYDIPVDGEWVTIAVVAERGDVRLSGYKDASDSESDGEEKAPAKIDEKTGKAGSASDKKGQQPKKRRAKKYINFRLAALPPRSSAVPGATVAGDALLQLLLFEADHAVRQEGNDAKKTYKGGSGGAYERWCNLNPGDVIGLVNPKVLRPLKAGSASPHPMTLPLALNPYSADSMFLIGKCRDLGQCTAVQKDGNRCTSWVDLRQSAVCEYHVHLAIQRQKAGRAEFTASTASFGLQTRQGSSRGGYGGSSSSRGGRPGTAINHQTKTGLLPGPGPQAAPRGLDNGGGGVTYMVGGGVIRSDGSRDGGLKGWGDEHLSEKLGRGRAEKRRKRMSEKEAEEALNKLVGRKEGVGGEYLAAAARHRRMQEENDVSTNRKGKEKGAEKGQQEEEDQIDKTRKAFSSDSIKKIGFDPTNLSSNPRYADQNDKKRKAEAIASLKTVRKEFDPDAKVKRANVRPPPTETVIAPVDAQVATSGTSAKEDDMIDLE